MRYFVFTYKELNKYASGNIYKRFVTLSKSTGDIGIDAKQALGLFISCTGNLKKFDIIEIQEVDAEGNPIGEPIKPVGENAILPTI